MKNYYTRMINKTEDYIEDNLDKKINLKELADNVYLTEYHFHRIFKKYSKENLHEFITRIKMERSAIYLVINKNITITEIAYKYGYADSSSYCRAFKKYYKKTPTEYRKEQEKTINKF